MRGNLFVALLFLISSLSANAQDRAGEEPAVQFKKLVSEFAAAQKEYARRLDKTTTLDDQARLFREESPHPVFAARFLELARKYPKDAVAYQSLNWILQNSECGPGAEKPFTAAINVLADRYADHAESEALFERLVNSPFPSARVYLEAVFAKHPSAEVRGRAGFHAALFLKAYCDTVYQLGIMPVWAKNVELFMGADAFQQMKNTDTAPLLRHMEDLLVKVQKEYPLVPYKRTYLVRATQNELFELRHLAIGKTIPEIETEDTEGKKFKLSDYRGKVVLLVFWGTWCGHCMKMLPQERALVKRYEGQPFAIVGVNSDADREKLKPALVKHQITWRSFWDENDAIATRWNVQGWPAIYVLDQKGVIRSKFMRDEMLDRVIGDLMKEAK